MLLHTMNQLKTVVILLAILIAAVSCSFYFEAGYRRLIRYLYEITSGVNISFVLPKKNAFYQSEIYTFFLTIYNCSLSSLVKKTGRQILLKLALAIFLFSLSVSNTYMALRGKENANSNDVKGWVGASENYTLVTVPKGIDQKIEIDVTDGFKDFFLKTWTLALFKVKELAEGS